MGSATATSKRTRIGAGVRPADFREALERALAAADADERIGPQIRATEIRMRFEFPDCATVLNVSSEADEASLRWSFADDVDWEPKLVLTMDSDVANRYLQGRESLAIAIARGQVRCTGSSRAALLYLPAARLLCEPYRKVVAQDFPELAEIGD